MTHLHVDRVERRLVGVDDECVVAGQGRARLPPVVSSEPPDGAAVAVVGVVLPAVNDVTLLDVEPPLAWPPDVLTSPESVVRPVPGVTAPPPSDRASPHPATTSANASRFVTFTIPSGWLPLTPGRFPATTDS